MANFSRLTGKQVAQIRDAILSGFDRGSLRVLTRIELDENLDSIAGGETFPDSALSLIEWAERVGRVDDLVLALSHSNPTNPQVQALVQSSIGWHTQESRLTVPVQARQPSDQVDPNPPLVPPKYEGAQLPNRRVWIVVLALGAILAIPASIFGALNDWFGVQDRLWPPATATTSATVTTPADGQPSTPTLVNSLSDAVVVLPPTGVSAAGLTAMSTQALDALPIPTLAAVPSALPTPTNTITPSPSLTPPPTIIPTHEPPATRPMQSVGKTVLAATTRQADLRAGPGLLYPVVGRTLTGQGVDLVARTADGMWFLLDNGSWILRSELVEAPLLDTLSIMVYGTAESVDSPLVPATPSPTPPATAPATGPRADLCAAVTAAKRVIDDAPNITTLTSITDLRTFAAALSVANEAVTNAANSAGANAESSNTAIAALDSLIDVLKGTSVGLPASTVSRTVDGVRKTYAELGTNSGCRP